MSLLDVFSLLGGVGLFLYGMTLMSSGLRNAAGDNLRVILEKATSNRIMAVGVGILVTLMIQSSSATDVMVIGFVNSGLMTLTQAIGVIMGANVGTTITAQLTAFNLSAYAPLILFVGAIMYLFFKQSFTRYIGSIILGFGMLFVGISIMKSAIIPLSETEEFINLLSGLNNPLLAVLFGVAFTALLQSSSSSTVIFQAFAVQGILTYHTAVYLVIGAAIGSVTPNLLASLTANRNGKRSAILNLMFNIIRAILLSTLIGIFPQILDFIQSLSPDNIGRQIANTHTFFAIVAVVAVLPFSHYIVKLAEKIIPILPEETKKSEDQRLVYMNHLDDIPPALALRQAQLEVVRMGKFAVENLRHSVECFFSMDDNMVQSIVDDEDTVDYLDHTITQALIQLRYHHLSDHDLERLSHMMLAVSDIERISDHAMNICDYMQKMRDRKANISEDGMDDILHLAKCSLRCIEYCLGIFGEDRYDDLYKAEQLEDIVDEQEQICIANHVNRMIDKSCDPMGGVIFSDIVTDLERCSDHAINIAYSLSGKEE